MLVHHFGSRERLVSEALGVVRSRQVRHYTSARASATATFDEVFRESWKQLASPEFRRYFLLNHELVALALREPRRYRAFLQRTTEEWRTGLAAALREMGFPEEESVTASTMYMAVIRGLLLDLAVTGDAERVERAVALVAERLKADLRRYDRS
jgi:AcrR family transcriptional regulator